MLLISKYLIECVLIISPLSLVVAIHSCIQLKKINRELKKLGVENIV